METIIDKLFGFVPKAFRPTVIVLMFLVVAGVGYGLVTARAEAVVDARILTLTGQNLTDHERRIAALEQARLQMAIDLATVKTDVAVIRTEIEDRLPERKR